MASNPGDGQPQPGQKTLHVWSKPIEGGEDAAKDGATSSSQRPTISDAVSMIKTEDFTNIPNTPCARQGLLTGIATGAGVGGLRFVVKGSHNAAVRPVLCSRLTRCRKRYESRQLGSRVLPPRKRNLIRILPIPTPSRADPNEATHRGGIREQKRASKEADGGEERAGADRARAQSCREVLV